MNPESAIQSESLNRLAKAQLPIFFVQLGNHVNLFVDQVLQEAVRSNGKENVYVLTDANFHLYQPYNCIDVSEYMRGQQFDALYTHHSTNTYIFEKSCFDRWFIINDLVKKLNISTFFHADCDVLILEDLKPVYQYLRQNSYEGSVMFFEHEGRSITSGHSSFWSNKLIGEFCDFVCEKYADEKAFATILKDTQAGFFLDNTNVSDMILLDVFRREKQPSAVNLFTLEDEGKCFDFNINVAYNGHKHTYVTRPVYKIKAMTRLHGALYGKTKEQGASQYLKFYTLHFQGYLTKTLIPIHITYKNNFERMQNWFLSERSFTIRKMKLSKNKVRDAIKKLIGMK